MTLIPCALCHTSRRARLCTRAGCGRMRGPCSQHCGDAQACVRPSHAQWTRYTRRGPRLRGTVRCLQEACAYSGAGMFATTVLDPRLVAGVCAIFCNHCHDPRTRASRRRSPCGSVELVHTCMGSCSICVGDPWPVPVVRFWVSELVVPLGLIKSKIIIIIIYNIEQDCPGKRRWD